jgi:hypothetical protein
MTTMLEGHGGIVVVRGVTGLGLVKKTACMP